MSLIQKANALFSQKNYEEALEIYKQLAETNVVWKRVLEPNIEACIGFILERSVEKQDHLISKLNILSTGNDRAKVLVTDFRYPRFDKSAGELATYGIIQMLVALGYSVIFIPKESTTEDTRYIKSLRRMGVKCIEYVTYNTYQEHVKKHCHDLHIAYIFRPDVAKLCIPVVKAENPSTYIFYHAPDIYFRREKAQQKTEEESGKSPSVTNDRISSIAEDEVYSALEADHVICVGSKDAQSLSEAIKDPSLNQKMVTAPPITVFPILYLERKTKLPKFDDTRDICFIGSSEHEPNRDAIGFFLDSIWPNVLSSNPTIEFHVIGNTSQEDRVSYESHPNVRVIGWVESIEEILPRYRLSVAPLRYGAGIKGKVGISLITGVPCVATPVAIEDMSLAGDHEITIAETPEGFASNIINLLSDEDRWQSLSASGAQKAEQLYSHDATLKQFIKVLHLSNVLNHKQYIEFIDNIGKTGRSFKFNPTSPEESPDVSIIVPGYNKTYLSRACLTSVYYSICSSNKISYEIIYADDCSTEKSEEVLSQIFDNLTIIKTTENSGFIKNVNNASIQARGKVIVLLNNDTVVLPDWLEGLLEVVTSTEKCFVAGSKIVYPSGLIQEAGGGIWTDAQTCSIGRGMDGTGLENTRLEYNYVREVDYVSFASTAIKADFWHKIGGLSDEYGLGYYDDSDFCMAVRENGGVVLYAPQSEVIHIESRTFSSIPKKLLAQQKSRNSLLFRTRWNTQLISNHLTATFPAWDPGYGESICKANAERHKIVITDNSKDLVDTCQSECKGHILYFSPFPSHPASHGNQTTIQKFGLHLQSRGYKVHFVLLSSHMYSDTDLQDMINCWDTFDLIKTSHFPSCNGEVIRYDGWYVPGIGEQIASLCIKHSIDIAICSYIFQSRMLDYIPSYILKVIDTHDQFTNRYSILDGLGKPREFFSCTREEEGQYLSRADICLARRDEESHYFDSISEALAYTVPHIEEPNYLAKASGCLKKVGLVASSNLINLDIIVSFLAELIQQKADNWGFEVYIAGEVKMLMDEDDPQHCQLLSHPDIAFKGYVDSIKDFYDEVDLVVCPIMSGTGINVKTVQALAYGMPLLATKHASKGIHTTYFNHSFKTIQELVTFLITSEIDQAKLSEYASQSRSLYESFIRSAYSNFANALDLQNSGLSRKHIAAGIHTSLSERYARKATLAALRQMRNHTYVRNHFLMLIAKSVVAYGPNWINLNDRLPNIQPNGNVGFWFQLDSQVESNEDLFLHAFNDKFRFDISDDRKLLTSAIPAELFKKESIVDLLLGFSDPHDEEDFHRFRLGKLQLVNQIARAELLEQAVANITAFGPDWINLNDDLPNIQPNGNVGFWFQFNSQLKTSEDLFLHAFNDKFKLDISDDKKLLTTSIPAKYFTEESIVNLVLGFSDPHDEKDIDRFKLATLQLVNQVSRAELLMQAVVSISGYGPDMINLNDDLPNIQPDGNVGFWFKLDKPIVSGEELFLHAFNGKFKLDISDDRMLLTTSIPRECFNSEGSIRLMLGFSNPSDREDNHNFLLGKLMITKI